MPIQFTHLYHLRREVWEGNPVLLLRRDIFALLWASDELRCHTAAAFQVALKVSQRRRSIPFQHRL